MISDEDRAEIAASVARRDVDAWPPLTTAERDLLRGALALPPESAAS